MLAKQFKIACYTNHRTESKCHHGPCFLEVSKSLQTTRLRPLDPRGCLEPHLAGQCLKGRAGSKPPSRSTGEWVYWSFNQTVFFGSLLSNLKPCFWDFLGTFVLTHSQTTWHSPCRMDVTCSRQGTFHQCSYHPRTFQTLDLQKHCS